MPKQTKNWVDFKEVKSISIERILEHYGLLETLKRKGSNLTGPCPLHKGTNATQFHVSLTKNNYNCFGDCKGGGNIIDFVCAMEGLDRQNPKEFREAALLIQEWGLTPGHGEPQPETIREEPAKEPPSKEKKEVADQVINPPLKFALKNLDSNHPCLAERRLEKPTIQFFGLGFCSKGMMTGRIAIPIHNDAGELVARDAVCVNCDQRFGIDNPFF